MRTSRWFTLITQLDATLNSSNKPFTVPAGKIWRPIAIAVDFISTATVGNRQIDVNMTDASGNLFLKYQAGAVQAASLTRDYYFAIGHPQEVAFTNGNMLRAIAQDIVLPAGYILRILDSAAIDAAADDMTVRMLIEEMIE